MTPETAARKLARSKRFWTGLIGLFALMFSAFLPGLEEHLSTIQPGIVAIVGTMIGGYSLEDFGRQLKKTPLDPPQQD